MKLTRFDHPVMSSWLPIKGSRLDSKPYLSGAMEARMLLEKLRVESSPLCQVTKEGMDGIFNGPRFSRTYVDDPKYGVPFLGSTDILVADLSTLPLLSKKIVEHYPNLFIQEGWTLITCSGTIGRMSYARSDMVGMAGSQHFMRVVSDPDKIPTGYLHAYLSSKFGVPQVVEGTYGALIQHIEPHHIADLPVPRLSVDVEEIAHHKIVEAARLRSEYQGQVKQATELLFRSVGLQDITAKEWHGMGPDLGFSHAMRSSESLRALNFNSRLEACLENLSRTNHITLGEICQGGKLRSGLRFKRIDCDPELGVKLIGQRELFWLEPEGRWISATHAPNDIFVDDETILIAAQGTLGEHEVFCRAEFINGPWLRYAYTQHVLRVQSGNEAISGAFLFAFLRSEMVFRCLRSMSIGSKQQDLHRAMLARLPVPIPPDGVRSKIEQLVRDAYAKRHRASQIEREAVALVETTIEEGARWQQR